MDIKRIPLLPGRWIILAMVDGRHFQAEVYRRAHDGKPIASVYGHMLSRDTDGPYIPWLADCPISDDGNIIRGNPDKEWSQVSDSVLSALTADLKRYL